VQVVLYMLFGDDTVNDNFSQNKHNGQQTQRRVTTTAKKPRRELENIITKNLTIVIGSNFQL